MTDTLPEPRARSLAADPGDEGQDQDQDDPDGSAVLPDTGGPSLWLSAGAGGAVLLGLVLVVVARRRTRDGSA